MKHCIECKYFITNEGSEYLGKCKLNCRFMRPNGVCENFTLKNDNSSDKVLELEQRVARLESKIDSLIIRLL